jgi:hypothetical protein
MQRSSIPKPGFVSGPCLEKDAYILSSNMADRTLKRFSFKYPQEQMKM